MKYFTPVRYLKLGNLDDEQTFLAAQEEWEQAIEDYKTHLEKISDKLPVSLRRLLEKVYLHDARVLDMWIGQVSRCTITLQPRSEPSRLVVLTYSLEGSPTIEPDALPMESRSEPVTWLYDELDVKGDMCFHNILLSNGWELQLCFRNVAVSYPKPLIPTTAVVTI